MTTNRKPGNRNRTSRNAAPIGSDMVVSRITHRTSGGGARVTGTSGGHGFEALVFAEHAECPDYELGDSRISKLWLKRLADGRCAASFDRGWDIRPRTKTGQAIVDFLAARLTERVYYNKPACRRGTTPPKDFTIDAIEHRSAREAIQHVSGSYYSHAILWDGKYLTATQADLDRLAEACVEFAYLFERHGKIMTLPVNDR